MIFKIKQGDHYSDKGIYKLYKSLVDNTEDRIAYSVVLSKDAWYPKGYVGYSGWNKIFGYGGINHHNNSARLVWQPSEEEGKLIIAAYVYEEGEWTATEFSHCYTDAAINMTIEITKNGYKFYCGKDEVEIQHYHTEYRKLLYPYFGGRDRAYKDITIKLKKINE
jgi:hypothetical protein